MTYTIRSQSGPVIETKDYDDLDEAIEAATFSMTGGIPIEITVTDEDGVEIIRQLHNV